MRNSLGSGAWCLLQPASTADWYTWAGVSTAETCVSWAGGARAAAAAATEAGTAGASATGSAAWPRCFSEAERGDAASWGCSGCTMGEGQRARE